MSKNSGSTVVTNPESSGSSVSSGGGGKNPGSSSPDFADLSGTTDPRSFMMHVDTVAQNMAQDWSNVTKQAIDAWRPRQITLNPLHFWLSFGMGLFQHFTGTVVALRLTGLLLRPISMWANQQLDRSTNGNANAARSTIRRAFQSQYQSVFRTSNWQSEIESVSAELYPALASAQPSTYTRIIRDAIRQHGFIEDRESNLRRDIHHAMSRAWADAPRATDTAIREQIHQAVRDQREDTALYRAGRMQRRRYERRRDRRREGIRRLERRLERRFTNREVRMLRDAGFQ